jgi:hypothetical protein
MGLFTKNEPAVKLQSDLDVAQGDLKAARAGRDNFIALKKAAEATATECGAVVDQLGDDAADDIKLQPAIDRQIAADKTVTVRMKALAGADNKVAALEARVADLADQKLRGETAATENAMVDKWARVAATVDAAIAELVSISRETSPIVLDANGLQAFAQDCRTQIPPAIAVIVSGLKAHAAAVLAGTAKASLLRPDEPTPKLRVIAPPPTKTVFFLRASKWTDETGKLHLIQKFNDAVLPPALATHAIKVGAAVEMTDPVRKPNHGSWNGRQFHAEHCFALDAASETSHVPPIMASSPFEPHPSVGPTIHGTMSARGRP